MDDLFALDSVLAVGVDPHRESLDVVGIDHGTGVRRADHVSLKELSADFPHFQELEHAVQ
jgi:hypothetical protein